MMPETSQARSGTTRFLHHPLVPPTLFVLGGWGLLLGGYLPARSPIVPASADAPEGAQAARAETVRPTVSARIEDRSASESRPIRLTIEFPGNLPRSAVVTVADPESTAIEATQDETEPGAASARRPAPRDAEILQTRSAGGVAPVVPPAIPGPPPAFNPAVLSPLIPESVPDSPLFGRDGESSADPLIAKPMGDLPEAFDPGPLLDRYRSGEPSERRPMADISGVEPVAGTVVRGALDRGDQAPEPPAIAQAAAERSTAPEILPEPLTEPDRLLMPSTSAPGLQAAGIPAQGSGPIRPIRHPQPPDRRGLKKLFRAYLPPPAIPLVPPPPPQHMPSESDGP